jgi:hypothetical protein
MASEKSISVRVVEMDEGTVRSSQTLQITPERGVEAAVRAAYPVFPNNCVRVVLVRGRTQVLLWHRHTDRWEYSDRVAYDMMQEDDVVEVQVRVSVVGPDTPSRHWVPDGAGAPGDDRLPGPGRGEGPHGEGARLVSELLSQLERV